MEGPGLLTKKCWQSSTYDGVSFDPSISDTFEYAVVLLPCIMLWSCCPVSCCGLAALYHAVVLLPYIILLSLTPMFSICLKMLWCSTGYYKELSGTSHHSGKAMAFLMGVCVLTDLPDRSVYTH